MRILTILSILILISAGIILIPLIRLPINRCNNVSQFDTFSVKAMQPPYGYYAKLGIAKDYSQGKNITLCLVTSSDHSDAYNIDVEFTLPDGIILKNGSLKQKAVLRKEQIFTIDVEITNPARYVISGGMRSQNFSAYDEAVLDALDPQVTFYEEWGKSWPGSYQRIQATGRQIPHAYLPNLYPSVEWQPVAADHEVWYTNEKRELNLTDGYTAYSRPVENLSESQISSFMNYYHNSLKILGWKKVYASKSLFQSHLPSEDYVYQKEDYSVHFGINFNPFSKPNQFYVKHN